MTKSTQPPLNDNFDAFLTRNPHFNGKVTGAALSLKRQTERMKMPKTTRTLKFMQEMICLNESPDPHIIEQWYNATRFDKSAPRASPLQISKIVEINNRARELDTGALGLNSADVVLKKAWIKEQGWTSEFQRAFIHAFAEQHLAKLAQISRTAALAWLPNPQIRTCEDSFDQTDKLIARFTIAGTITTPARYEALLRMACVDLAAKIIDKVEDAWRLPAELRQNIPHPKCEDI